MAAGLITALVVLRKRKKKDSESLANPALMNKDIEKGAGPRRFSYTDLASATNNFLDERRLGEGGFGAVYKGYLHDDWNTAVAVKKISKGSRQGKKDYVTEVKLISSLRHRNLVQVMGWCHERGEFLLVYEFMPNGSLDTHLFGSRSLLTWDVRYKISPGLASALFYLHEEWEQCVVHRDIKPSKHNARFQRPTCEHELGPHTTGLAGTLGYLAREYMRRSRVSKESDAYSFGVVILEIATGRKLIGLIEKGFGNGGSRREIAC